MNQSTRSENTSISDQHIPAGAIGQADQMAAPPKASKSKINIQQKQDVTESEKFQDSAHLIESHDLECPVCLQTCIHPVQLPCKHIFCFLCVKGAANRSKRCALCRQEISPEFFQKPKLMRQADLEKTAIFDSKYQWFYEGRNGWWQYDDRTSQELEVKFKEGEKVFELLIAGFLYVIDLEEMIQYRRNDRSRKRNMKRDLITMTGVKGVAGLKYASQVNSSAERPGGDGLEQQSTVVINPISPTDSTGNDDLLSPPAPNNTPQTPQTPADSPPSSTSGSQQDLSSHFHNLTLTDSSQVNRHQNTTSNHSSSHLTNDLSDSDGHANFSTQTAIGHLSVDQIPYIDEQDVYQSFESDSNEEI